jgi:hypothetical protein
MTTTTFRLPSKNFRSIPSPVGSSKFGLFFTPTSKLDQGLWDWREVNPREVNTKTTVYKAIAQTLSQEPERFHERNRGITIVAESLTYDDKHQEVVIGLSEKTSHGVVDGAHTLHSILGQESQPGEASDRAYVFIKVVTGIEASEIAEIAGGLNTSQQVDLKSLENLREHFNELKRALANEPYADQIAYKMNEDLPVDVREVLYYLAVFDCSIYSDKQHPVALFGRKEGIVRRFAEQAEDPTAGDSFRILISKAPEILRLRDLLEKRILEKLDGRYKAGRSTRVRSESNKNNPLVFLGELVNGRVPLGWIMPILGGFRANVKWNKPKGTFSWIIPIDEIVDSCIDGLISAIKEIHASENSRPEYVGRNALAWRISYDTVSRAILQWELAQARSNRQ